MRNYGLTPEQAEARKHGIGGSEAAMIAAGRWYQLWLVKTGRAEFKSPLTEWNAAMRHCTEPLNLDWYEHTTGNPLTRRGESVIGEKPYIRATLDGFDETLPGPVDAKHLSIWTPGDPIEWCYEHYFPQMQHQMYVTQTEKSALSVIVGVSEPEVVYVEYDPFWVEIYVEQCEQFWHYVETDQPPPDAPPLEIPPYDTMRVVEMEGKNSWAAYAEDWLSSKTRAKLFAEASEALREMMPPDAKMASGHGIIITRTKGGALRIKAANESFGRYQRTDNSDGGGSEGS